MKKKNLIFIAILISLLIPMGVYALTLDEAQLLLENMDMQMNFDEGDFTAVMTMISEDPESGIEKNVIQQFRRDSEDKFLMLFQEPVTQRGQGYLMIDDSLWFYDPESRKFSHTSMKEQFAQSDANNSDFGESSVAEDYKVVSLEEGTLGKFNVYIMELEGRHNEVTYPRTKIWMTRDTNLVLKTEDYSANDRLMRTQYLPSYAKVGDKYMATKMIFIDNLVEGKKTQISITDISIEDLPDTLFSKAYVERVNR
ncbi:MAG: outer membrane lipoprotein-sorting protein [Spirochaetales bacterium]|jgi:outer membrane lipoprotein-sorting protein|nr:outer membrane lipoprotein-sorting protein [Spirochaetales bacterium]